MAALKNSSDGCKGLIKPIFILSKWLGSNKIDNSIDKIKDSFSNRTAFLTICDYEDCLGDRPVHHTLKSLYEPDYGYQNWCSFFSDHSNFVPSLILRDISNLPRQIENLYAFNRGLLIPFERDKNFSAIESVCSLISNVADQGKNISILLDFKKLRQRDIISRVGEALDYIERIYRKLPEAKIIISSSSFPDGFTGIENQQIYEKLAFTQIAQRSPLEVIYSDRGSARSESIGGGGAIPYARIDYATKQSWEFFRAATEGSDFAKYRQQAEKAIESDNWDQSLKIWGTQLIESTATGDTYAIKSARDATSARINIHLHQQAYAISSSDGIYDTDDDWTD